MYLSKINSVVHDMCLIVLLSIVGISVLNIYDKIGHNILRVGLTTGGISNPPASPRESQESTEIYHECNHLNR